MNKEEVVDFIGLGAPKCGTTWVTDCLREHPQVGYPKMNELNYFSKTRANNTKSEYSFRGIKGYLDLFKGLRKGKVKVIGEFSTHYLADSSAAPIIKKYFPNVKILVALRDPIERAYSDYLNNKTLNLNEKDNFETAFFKRRKSYYDNYLDKGLYYKQLIPYIRLFPKKNIKIIIFDDIKNNPKKVIKEIYEFIGVNSSFVPLSASKTSNIASESDSKGLRKVGNVLSRIVHFNEKIGLGILMSFLKRKLSLDAVYWKILEKNRKPLKKVPLPIEIRRKLIKVYAEDIKNLEKLMGRKLDSWKK